MSLDVSVTNHAVGLLKAGHDPEAVIEALVEAGVDGEPARTLVEQLVELKRRALAQDPEGLRREATRMYEEDHVAVDDVVAFMVEIGIPEMYARPEAERLYALYERKMATRKPCDRCRELTFASDFFFDTSGNQICPSCNDQEQIAQGDRRVEDARLEAAGVSPLAIAQDHQLVFCPRCQDYTCTLQHATHTMSRGITSSQRVFACQRCGATVSG